MLAKASQQSIDMVASSIGDNEMPVVYLLGEKYIGAMQKLAASENSKMVFLPADLPNAIKGMMGKNS